MAAAACAWQARAETVRFSRKVRLGMVGFDGHPEEILRPLADFPDVELAAIAIAASDPATTATHLKNPLAAKARRYDTFNEMLNREQLDCVAICNQNGDRAAAIQAVLARKLDFIAEKPYALHRRDWEAVATGIARTGVRAGMLLPMRFDAPYRAMKQIVDSGEIGDPAQIDAQKSYQLDARPDWQKHLRSYGGTIPWIGVHMIDLMAFVSGREFSGAASVVGHVGFPDLGEMQNVTASVFRLDNGGTATLRMDYLRPQVLAGHGDDRLRVAGTRGIVEYREDSGVVVLNSQGRRSLTKLPEKGSVFADYLRWVYLGTAPQLTWKDIVRANEVTLAAQEAAELAQWVTVRQPARR
jgi:predicted dehydrogenase